MAPWEFRRSHHQHVLNISLGPGPTWALCLSHLSLSAALRLRKVNLPKIILPGSIQGSNPKHPGSNMLGFLSQTQITRESVVFPPHPSPPLFLTLHYCPLTAPDPVLLCVTFLKQWVPFWCLRHAALLHHDCFPCSGSTL